MNIGSPPPIINYNSIVPCANFSDKRRAKDAREWHEADRSSGPSRTATRWVHLTLQTRRCLRVPSRRFGRRGATAVVAESRLIVGLSPALLTSDNFLMLGNGVGRSDAAPIIDHRLLHPLEVHGIVDVTQLVDVGRFNGNGVLKGRHATHIRLALAYSSVNKIGERPARQ